MYPVPAQTAQRWPCPTMDSGDAMPSSRQPVPLHSQHSTLTTGATGGPLYGRQGLPWVSRTT
ncbi:MAG TPA: hypothetical protein VMZ06_11605, partial [Candidatus Bathyarchaeia archaeon]|nr:hypothetical protein [Candidatus Bathyarchaeia archaeon]